MLSHLIKISINCWSNRLLNEGFISILGQVGVKLFSSCNDFWDFVVVPRRLYRVKERKNSHHQCNREYFNSRQIIIKINTIVTIFKQFNVYVNKILQKLKGITIFSQHCIYIIYRK